MLWKRVDLNLDVISIHNLILLNKKFEYARKSAIGLFFYIYRKKKKEKYLH